MSEAKTAQDEESAIKAKIRILTSRAGKQIMPEAIKPERPHIHWLYLWLAISVAGNIIGLSSLVDGIVIWADFFKHIIELYREYIRGPIAFVGNHLWPFGKLPGWVFDVLIVYSMFIVALNIRTVRHGDRNYFVGAYDYISEQKSIYRRVYLFVLLVIAWPIIVIFGSFGASRSDAYRKYAREIMSFVIMILAIFIILLFINYQIQHHH